MKKTFKIATPVSHLFENNDLILKVIALSDLLELRDNGINIEQKIHLIYHSELNILSKWGYREIKLLEKVSNNYKIKFVSYHLSSRYQKNIIHNNAFIGVGQPFSVKEMKNNIKDNLKMSMEIFGYNTPILVENTNHLLTDAYDIITEADFIREIVEENDLYLLLDLPHAKITSINKNINFLEYLKKLPLDSCKQLHLSRYSLNNEKPLDTHDELKSEDWKLVKEILKLLDFVEIITIEYYKDKQKLFNQLKILKELQKETLLNNMLEILEWDSSFFGYKVAKLDSSDLNESLLKKCIENAKKKKIKCLYCLSDPEKANLLENFGFKRIDEKTEYTLEVKKVNMDNNIKIEKARKEDVPEIKKIASIAFRGMSRFYKDSNFNKNKVDTLYEKWIDKLMSEKESIILIIRKNNSIAAFNGISIKNGEGRIELIAVDQKYKNKGYGELLLHQAQKFFDKKNMAKKKIIIKGHRIYLRPLTEIDVSEKYCSWINDPQVTKYLESKKTTIEELRHYIKIRYKNPNCLFLGIFIRDGDIHIGNVKLEPIDFKERIAKLGLLIGEKDYWNQGYETETYTILENYAFKNLKLKEIDTGVYKEDIVEINQLEKSGFNIYEENENVYKMRVSVATQQSNIAAKKLYSKMGFVNKQIQYWFHWWNEEMEN